MKNVLITGASGMLGATLVNVLSNQYNVFATGNSNFDNSFINYKTFDLSNDSYEELIRWSNPEIIIHSAALTNGNYCNQNPEEAFKVNGLSVNKFLSATTNDVKIIYISTDAVFPSELSNAKETDCVFPENIYGKSKELGEFFLLNSKRDYTIIRTTIVGLNINKNKKGFVEWIINASLKGDEICLFDDVVFTPISIWHLANETINIIESSKSISKTYHIVGNESCTKYTFGVNLLTKLNLPINKVKRGSIKMFKDRAKRCSDQSMSCTLYEQTFNKKLPSLNDTIQEIKKQYYE